MLPNVEIKQLFRYIPCFKMKEKDDEHQEFFNTIAIAHQEWIDAENFFENVVELELVDHAIYKIEAAKSKYIYLLKLAKENGISVNM